MKTWKVIRIYKVPASSKQQALETFHREGSDKFFDSEFAVEETPTTFWQQVKKQLLG